MESSDSRKQPKSTTFRISRWFRSEWRIGKMRLLAPLIFLAYLCSFTASSISSWPKERTQDDRVQAFQEDGRWINAWSEEKPSILSLISDIALGNSKDESSLPDDENLLEKELPVHKPYWLIDNKDASINNNVSDLNNGSENGLKNGIKATWLGHSTLLIDIDGHQALTDPIFSQRASPLTFVGPKRYRPAACTVDELPDGLEYVVISHTHYDHLDQPSVVQLHEKYGTKITWLVPKGAKSWFDSLLSDEAKVVDLTWWESFNSTDQLSFVFLPANHWSRRSLFDGGKSLWGSWAIIGPNHRFWFGGDTAYSAEAFLPIGKHYGPFDLSAIPVGAYAPRWFMKWVHVDPEEALQIHRDVRSKRSLAIHWGSFKLTFEHYLEPRKMLTKIARENNQDFVAIDIGQTLMGPDQDSNNVLINEEIQEKP